MAPTTEKDHIVLLFACLKNSKGPGQIDLKGVANDTGLTANAVSKRFKRLSEDYGVRGVLRSSGGRVPAARAKNRTEHEEGEQSDSQEGPSRAKGKRSQARSQGGVSKRRKMKQTDEASGYESDGAEDQQVDYDTLDAVAGEEEDSSVKAEFGTEDGEDGEDEVCSENEDNTDRRQD
ncbi:hypothetical protein E4T38_06764 [Aureobasidium subglaciale]|nr:hypothetical protein E4T38_06764 [Aureobasidium subglaciale]KAI5222446.1 hypothetical protein E4T41_06615 [Aureobasidium subglaciale]KAI5223307.1 hypothetical protein E4T40_04531 [Aureobasidium subglaciale]KAI5259919.1 hypothetical protein E4T46_06502 [Aureobasidium subglaciale]